MSATVMILARIAALLEKHVLQITVDSMIVDLAMNGSNGSNIDATHCGDVIMSAIMS